MRGVAIGTSVLAGLLCGASGGQTSSYKPRLTFDVATVREAKLSNSYTVREDSNPHSSYLMLQNFDVNNLLSEAYGVQWYQLANLPNWRYPTMFTVEAKSGREADEVLAKLSDADAILEKRHMLQVLLEERFHLKTHWETRTLSAYELVVSKPGLMKESTGTPPTEDEQKNFGKSAVPPLYQRNDGKRYDFIAHGAPMRRIVQMLQGQMSRPVTDKTGLQGTYDFVLPYRGRTDRDRTADDQDPMLPMDQAIQQVLGLKLRPAQGPVQMLVVDHIEKPTEN